MELIRFRERFLERARTVVAASGSSVVELNLGRLVLLRFLTAVVVKVGSMVVERVLERRRELRLFCRIDESTIPSALVAPGVMVLRRFSKAF